MRNLERRTSLQIQNPSDAASNKTARLTRLRALFDAWDRDGSEKVDVKEMRLAVRSFREGLSTKSVNEQANAVLTAMDTDADGTVSWEEMQAFFSDVLEQVDDKLFDETLVSVDTFYSFNFCLNCTNFPKQVLAR